jgi:hypothetical protein
MSALGGRKAAPGKSVAAADASTSGCSGRSDVRRRRCLQREEAATRADAVEGSGAGGCGGRRRRRWMRWEAPARDGTRRAAREAPTRDGERRRLRLSGGAWWISTGLGGGSISLGFGG